MSRTSASRATSLNVRRIARGAIFFDSVISWTTALKGLSSTDGARKPPVVDGNGSSDSSIGPSGSRSTCHRRISTSSCVRSLRSP